MKAGQLELIGLLICWWAWRRGRRRKQLLNSLKKKEMPELGNGSTRSYSMENSLWNWLWTCRWTIYVMNGIRKLWYFRLSWDKILEHALVELRVKEHRPLKRVNNEVIESNMLGRLLSVNKHAWYLEGPKREKSVVTKCKAWIEQPQLSGICLTRGKLCG